MSIRQTHSTRVSPSAWLSRLLMAAALCFGNAFAADTGSTSAEPTAAERLDNARKLIANKNWRNAIAELRLAVKADPNSADAHNLLGYSFRKQTTPDLEKAFEHYRASLKLNPKHKGTHEYIGEAYLMANKPAEAQTHLDQLEQICGNKTCEEYVDLSQAIAAHKAGKPVPNSPNSASRW